MAAGYAPLFPESELETYVPPADHLALPLRLGGGAGELRPITTLTSVATAVDMTLAELHLEAFPSADEQTARILRSRFG